MRNKIKTKDELIAYLLYIDDDKLCGGVIGDIPINDVLDEEFVDEVRDIVKRLYYWR